MNLVFFEKSQKELVSALKEQKQIKVKEEKFDILLKGLSADEKKVIKAVKEQDGITQQTLRLRTDLHKSKLSIVLEETDEADFWLEFIIDKKLIPKNRVQSLLNEASELTAIFFSSRKTARKKQ